MADLFKKVEEFLMYAASIGMRVLGPILCIGLHVLVMFHFYAYIKVISPLLKMRLGTPLGIVWISVGLALVYNICFNHIMAMIIKPGSPKDLRMVEEMRK